jgi:hypothetical protein
MDSHQIPLALVEKLQDLLPVRLGLLRTLQRKRLVNGLAITIQALASFA